MESAAATSTASQSSAESPEQMLARFRAANLSEGQKCYDGTLYTLRGASNKAVPFPITGIAQFRRDINEGTNHETGDPMVLERLNFVLFRDDATPGYFNAMESGIAIIREKFETSKLGPGRAVSVHLPSLSAAMSIQIPDDRDRKGPIIKRRIAQGVKVIVVKDNVTSVIQTREELGKLLNGRRFAVKALVDVKLFHKGSDLFIKFEVFMVRFVDIGEPEEAKTEEHEIDEAMASFME